MSTTSHGIIGLDARACTSCMLCVRECPTWCISLDSHQEIDPETAQLARPRTINVLDDFRIDFARCMSCGICIEVCPFDALHWAPAYDYPAATLTDLTHPTDRLASWAPRSR